MNGRSNRLAGQRRRDVDNIDAPPCTTRVLFRVQYNYIYVRINVTEFTCEHLCEFTCVCVCVKSADTHKHVPELWGAEGNQLNFLIRL